MIPLILQGAVKVLAASIWLYPERHNCCLLWWFYMYRPLALTNSSWWVMLFVGEILYQLRYMKESRWFYTLPTTNSLPLKIVSKRKGSSSKTIHFQGLYILVFLGEYSSTRLPTCHVIGFFAEVEKESCTIDLWDSSGLLPDLPVPSVCLGLPPI